MLQYGGIHKDCPLGDYKLKTTIQEVATEKQRWVEKIQKRINESECLKARIEEKYNETSDELKSIIKELEKLLEGDQ
jgi:predicted nuclease with TOPRIM domain